MNTYINDLVKELRNLKPESTKLKEISNELSHAFSMCGIEDHLWDEKWLLDYFGIKVQFVEKNITDYEIGSHLIQKSRLFSESSTTIYMRNRTNEELSPAERLWILKYGITLDLFRLDDYQEKPIFSLEYEAPILQSIKWTIGEKIFLYNLIAPSEKYLCFYKNFWLNVDKYTNALILEERNTTFVIEEFLKRFGEIFLLSPRLATMTYDFWHDILFEELKSITEMTHKRLRGTHN